VRTLAQEVDVIDEQQVGVPHLHPEGLQGRRAAVAGGDEIVGELLAAQVLDLALGVTLFERHRQALGQVGLAHPGGAMNEQGVHRVQRIVDDLPHGVIGQTVTGPDHELVELLVAVAEGAGGGRGRGGGPGFGERAAIQALLAPLVFAEDRPGDAAAHFGHRKTEDVRRDLGQLLGETIADGDLIQVGRALQVQDAVFDADGADLARRQPEADALLVLRGAQALDNERPSLI